MPTGFLIGTVPGVTNTVYSFKKEDGRWRLQLPQGLAQGWRPNDLWVDPDAGRLLGRFSGGRSELSLALSREPLLGACSLQLEQFCAPPGGGAIYRLRSAYTHAPTQVSFRICELALIIFGDLPECIYLRHA